MNDHLKSNALDSSKKVASKRGPDASIKSPNSTKKVSLSIDGEKIEAFQGMSILTCLLAHNKKAISKGTSNQITGAYCGMGVCFCCTVFVNGVKKRACKTLVENGAEIVTKTSMNDFISNFNLNN